MLPAACAVESLLVSALAMPPLSMQPAPRRSPIKLPMLDAVTVTVTSAVAECVSVPEVPVTVKLKFVGASAGEILMLRMVEAGFPPDGVTELADNEALTPAGCPDTLRPTAELNPFTGFTVTFVEPDPPAL